MMIATSSHFLVKTTKKIQLITVWMKLQPGWHTPFNINGFFFIQAINCLQIKILEKHTISLPHNLDQNFNF